MSFRFCAVSAFRIELIVRWHNHSAAGGLTAIHNIPGLGPVAAKGMRVCTVAYCDT